MIQFYIVILIVFNHVRIGGHVVELASSDHVAKRVDKREEVCALLKDQPDAEVWQVSAWGGKPDVYRAVFVCPGAPR